MLSDDPLTAIELDERIGEGGIADVFRGTWRGREIALKVLREADHAGLRKRFVREGLLLKRLSHPGLVRCLAVLGGDPPALVLELLSGASLDVRLREGRLTPDDGVLFASSVLRTLAYLHENGIVHRDIKPSNVWFGDDHRIVLLDLGLAADVSDPLTTTIGDVLGTHAYMAPEQIAGAESDHRCDLYSLGITLYEALCGERPYSATGLAGYLQAHRTAGAVPLVERVPGIPARLASLVERLMARDPAARPASASVALAQLTGSRGVRFALEAPRMVGREAATGAILAVLDGGGVLRVAGELGAGTGVVARHALALARKDGVEYASLRCRARSDPDELLAALIRELESIGGNVVPDLAGVLDLLRTLVAQDGRFLVVVEDLDLAPPACAALVDRVAQVPGIAMVVTGRSLAPVPAGRDLVLRPLTHAEVRAQIGSMLGTPTIPPGLDVALLRTSGGLPALVTAVLREHVDRGAVWCEGMGEDGHPRWSWDPSARMLPGEDTTRLFARALARLPEASRGLVQTLAVAGGPVPLDLLLRVANVDPSGLDLGPVLRSGLCEVTARRGEEWVSFRRAVLEAILLNTLAEPARRAVHLRLADAAGGRAESEWEQRFLLLHRARGAQDPRETARLVDLGDRLVAEGRPLVGLELLEVATHLPIDDRRVLARLALARCDALCAVGRLAEARRALEAGRALATDDAALVERASLATLELAMQLGAQVPPELRAAAVDPPADPSPRASYVAGALHLAAGDLDAASRCFLRALDGPTASAVDRVGAAARLGHARVVALAGDPVRAMALYRALAAELGAGDRIHAGCEALVRLAELQRCQGRLASASASLRAAQAVLGERSTPFDAAAVAIGRARVLLSVGDTEGAHALLNTYAACGEASAPWPVRVEYLTTLAGLRRVLGDAPAALAAHVRAAEGAAAMPDRPAHAFHAGMVGILTVDGAAVGHAVDELTAIGAPGLQARLLLLGGLTGRDRDVLTAAEAEARVAGDQLVLLEILHGRRDAEDRAEALAIVTASLDGLDGAFRERFLDLPAARWALGGAPRP